MGKKINRREFLENAGKAAVATSAVISAPYVIAQRTKTVRVLGTHVTLQEEIRQ